MTQKEFEKHMEVLEDKRTAIQREMQNMQAEYIANYPIQPDDKCVDRKGKICWVKELLFWTDLSTRLIIVVNYTNKDGSRSKRGRYIYDGDITKLNETVDK